MCNDRESSIYVTVRSRPAGRVPIREEEEEETDSLVALGPADYYELSIIMEESYVDFNPCMSGVHIVPRSLCRPTVKVIH